MLDNGLDVVVIEDHRAPVVSHMIWYRVGAADDPPGKSGLAHFLEHLLFNGTDDIPRGEFSAMIEARGGQNNAFTNMDYTAYFQRVERSHLGLMMQMEADRMRDLILDEAAVTREREVVLEERNGRIDSDPGGLFSEQRRAALYLNHPYGRPTIGWRHEIEGLELADAMAFYREYYAPNNAIVVVAGDVTPDEVRALAVEHYGPLAANPDITARMRPQEPPHLAARRLEFSDPRVRQPFVIRSYLAPRREPGAQEDAAALTLMADTLGGGRTSWLYQRLVVEEEVALSTGAIYSGLGLGPQSLGVYAVPVEGVSLDEVEARLDAALEDFLEAEIDLARLERVKTQIEVGQVFALDSQMSRARRYGAGLTSGLTIDDIEAWPGHPDGGHARGYYRSGPRNLRPRTLGDQPHAAAGGW